jgi:hypothetical protein
MFKINLPPDSSWEWTTIVKQEKREKLTMEFKELKEDFANMFGSCISCGTGLGWYKIIYNLTKELNNRYPNMIKVMQVKEKFGSLRYYTLYSSELDVFDRHHVSLLIRAAEDECDKTCEFCGSNDNVIKGGRYWIKTLCGKCREDYKKKEDERYVN